MSDIPRDHSCDPTRAGFDIVDDLLVVGQVDNALNRPKRSHEGGQGTEPLADA
ncbi:hypothetical protein [Rhodococcus marinonascens]|uniref:hypothetical protein n=1 Tax=Rhodococcus marinonascens TaxID=38311 RepID=UPI00147335B6|nr:hypothetical protein [Rhodococcus marinonascens]